MTIFAVQKKGFSDILIHAAMAWSLARICIVRLGLLGSFVIGGGLLGMSSTAKIDTLVVNVLPFPIVPVREEARERGGRGVAEEGEGGRREDQPVMYMLPSILKCREMCNAMRKRESEGRSERALERERERHRF